MYEYDLKLPYESQLVVSVKDWESLVGKKSRLIGKTTIDLENRFYSNCYATCGLAKKFEIDGYNKWRDALTPTQILNKLRKQWRLKKPEFTVDNKLKITNLDEQVLVYSLTNKFIGADDTEADDNELSSSVGDVEQEKKDENKIGTSVVIPGSPILLENTSSDNDHRIIRVIYIFNY